MRFRRKFEGQLNALRDKKRKNGETEQPPLKDSMEKGDLLAMILSALMVIVPVVLLILLAMAGVGYLFFFH